MLIKYKNKLVLDIDTTIVDELNYTTKRELFYHVDDIAVDKISNEYYAKVIGDIAMFKLNNPTVENVLKIPDNINKNIMYFSNDKYGEPTTVVEHFKIKAREAVDTEVGDIYDLLADASKRITMNERLLISLVGELIGSGHIPNTSAKYGGLVQLYNYYLLQNTGTLESADLEDPAELFAKLMNRSINITKIIKTEYKNKII